MSIQMDVSEFPFCSEDNNVDAEDGYFEEIVLKDSWNEVITGYYQYDQRFHRIKVKGRGTALHVAVSNGIKDAVKQLVEAILSPQWEWNDYDDDNETHPLRMRDEKGRTPLHIAAYRGFTDMCQCIIGKNGERKNLVRTENDNGETPIFWAVLGQQTDTFVYLRQFFPDDVYSVMDNHRKTILHVAIRRDTFDLANIIMHCYSSISSKKDKDGVIPLQELASRTSAFDSGNHLSWWKRIISYCCK
ncbi:hypothetical protein P8452_20154 [Trifolium repens]|nr:hypothetical protein P8452_20154 [Trifolium repens]